MKVIFKNSLLNILASPNKSFITNTMNEMYGFLQFSNLRESKNEL